MKIIFIILLIILLILSALLICVSSMTSTIANKNANKKIFTYYGNKRGGGIGVDIIIQLYSHLPKMILDIPQEYYINALADDDIFDEQTIDIALDSSNFESESKQLLINNYVVSKFIFDKSSSTQPYTYLYFTKNYFNYFKIHFNDILKNSQHMWEHIINNILLTGLSKKQLDSFKKHYDIIDSKEIDRLKEYCDDIMKIVQLNTIQEDIFDKFLKSIFLNNGLEYGNMCLIALLIVLGNIPNSILDNRSQHSVKSIIGVFIKKTIQFDLMIIKFYNILDNFIIYSSKFTSLDTTIANIVIENILESFDKYVLMYGQLFDAYIIFIRDKTIYIKSIMASKPGYILNIYIIAEYIESAEVENIPNSIISNYIPIFKKYYNLYWKYSILNRKTISFLEYGYIDTTTNAFWVINEYIMYNFIIVNFIECKIIKNILTMIGAIIYYISINDIDNANSIKDKYLAIILSICEITVKEFNVNTIIAECNLNSDIEEIIINTSVSKAQKNCYFYKKRISLLKANKEIMHSKYISAIENLKYNMLLSITDLINSFESTIIENIINIIIFFKMYLWMNQNIKLLEYTYMLDTKLLLKNGINTHSEENENSISQKVLLIGNNNNNNNYGSVYDIYKCFGVYNIYNSPSNYYLVDQNFWYSCTNWEDFNYWDNLNEYLGTKQFNALYIDKDSESALNKIIFDKNSSNPTLSPVGHAFIRCIYNHLSPNKCVIFVKIETTINSPIFILIYREIIEKHEMIKSGIKIVDGITYLAFTKGNIKFMREYNDILSSIDYNNSFNDEQIFDDIVVKIDSPLKLLSSVSPPSQPSSQLKLAPLISSPSQPSPQISTEINAHILYIAKSRSSSDDKMYNNVEYWNNLNKKLGTKKFNALYIDKASESDLNKIIFTKNAKNELILSLVGNAFIKCIFNHLSPDKCIIFVIIESNKQIIIPIYNLIYRAIIKTQGMKKSAIKIVYDGITYLAFTKGNITLPTVVKDISVLGYINSIEFITDTTESQSSNKAVIPMLQSTECNKIEKQFNDKLLVQIEIEKSNTE